MNTEESKKVVSLLNKVRRDSEQHSNQASQMMELLGKDHHDSKVRGTSMNEENIDSSIMQTIDLLDTVRQNSQLQGSQASQMIKLLDNDLHVAQLQSNQTIPISGNLTAYSSNLQLRDSQKSIENQTELSGVVKKQMIGILDTVRGDTEKPKTIVSAFVEKSKKAEEKTKIPLSSKRVKNYCSEKDYRVIEEKGYAKRMKDGFPPRKFEINYDNKNYIKKFAPYAPLHRKPSGDDTYRKDLWKVPYDNKNFAQALIYGGRSSFYPGDKAASDDNYRFNDVERNIYDYSYGPCKVSLGKSSKERKNIKTSDNYHFWDVERNIHDYEDMTTEDPSGSRKLSERKDNDYYYSYIEANSPDNQEKNQRGSYFSNLSVPEIQEQHKGHQNDFGVSHNEDFIKYLKENGMEMTINTQERWAKNRHKDDRMESRKTTQLGPNKFKSLTVKHLDDVRDKHALQIR